jgi:hypothetical protein
MLAGAGYALANIQAHSGLHRSTAFHRPSITVAIHLRRLI